MNVLDYFLIVVILLSVLVGLKKGLLSSVISTIGIIVVIIISFFLKNPISAFFYEKLPFFSFGGKFYGIAVYNILIYEGIAFLVTLLVLGTIFGIVSKVTGLFSKIVGSNILVSLPSKILGALFGFIKGYIIVFVLVFILGLTISNTNFYQGSKFVPIISSKTPVLSNVMENTYNSVKEVYEIATRYEKNEDKRAANLESLSVMLKYGIITADSAEKLVIDGKIKIDGVNEVIDIYRKDQR